MKTVVITGASRGIGLATAKLFHSRGWQVAATMRRPDEAVDLVEDERLVKLRLDVRDTQSISKAVADVISRFGKFDVWINNAGVGGYGPTEAATEEQIRRIFEVNVFGVTNCIKAALPSMKARGSGVIVNVSSIAGLMALPFFAVTSASKFAVEGLSEGMHLDLKKTGIKIKLVEPSAANTDFTGRSLIRFDQSGAPEYRDHPSSTLPPRFSPISRGGLHMNQSLSSVFLDFLVV